MMQCGPGFMEQADLLSAGQEGRPRLWCSKTERFKEETEGDSQTEERRLCPTSSANQDTGEGKCSHLMVMFPLR